MLRFLGIELTDSTGDETFKLHFGVFHSANLFGYQRVPKSEKCLGKHFNLRARWWYI